MDLQSATVILGADEVDSEVYEEAMDKSNEVAIGLFGEKNFHGRVEKYTEQARKWNGQAAALFAKRGQAYLKLGKPKACIRDCNRALEINPDSAMAYELLGRAHRVLDQLKEAGSKSRQGSKIDLDDQTGEVQPHEERMPFRPPAPRTTPEEIRVVDDEEVRIPWKKIVSESQHARSVAWIGFAVMTAVFLLKQIHLNSPLDYSLVDALKSLLFQCLDAVNPFASFKRNCVAPVGPNSEFQGTPGTANGLVLLFRMFG